MIGVRPSRLYRGRLGTAVEAVSIAFIAILFAVIFVVGLAKPHTDPATGAQVSTSPWMIIPTLVMVSVLFLIAHVIWSEIPPRIILATLDQASALCGDPPFVLILWSFEEYQDLLGTTIEYEGVHQMPVNVPQSLDGYITDAASEFGFRSIRLWQTDASRLVGVSSKSIQVICPDLIWRQVVQIALHAAVAIILIRGRGQGLAWEREVVATNPELNPKTLDLSVFKMTEVKPAITTHFERVTGRIRDTSHGPSTSRVWQ